VRDGWQAVMRQPLAKRLRARGLRRILNFGEAIYWLAVGDIFLDLREISLDCNEEAAHKGELFLNLKANWQSD
jgi:hypothetical protein